MMSVRRCLGIGLLLALVSITNTFAQDATFDHLDVQDGLAANVVYVMHQDSRGFLWFGTVFGLSRFDGHEFKTFRHDPSDPTSIGDNRIYEIVEDDDGILWIGTENGLNRFDPDTESFQVYQHDPDDPASLAGNDINVIMQDDGKLWVGTLGAGINLFDPETGKFTHFAVDPNSSQGLSDDRASDILRDDEGRLWIATMGGGLNELDEATGTFVHHQHEPGNDLSLKSNFINALAPGKDGMLWLGTDEGLVRFDPETEVFTNVALMSTEARETGLSDITVMPDGNMYITTAGEGLVWFDPETGDTRMYRYANNQDVGLASNEVEFAYQTKDGLLWIGTFNGMNRIRLEETVFKVFTPAPPMGIQQGHIRSMTWHNDMLWFGTGGGPNRYDPRANQFVSFDIDQTLPVLQDFAWSVLPDGDEFMWIGTDNGLSKLHIDRGLVAYYGFDPAVSGGLSDNSIRDIEKATNGDYWIGTLAGGLNRLDADTGRITSFLPDPNKPNSLSNAEVRVVHESPEGVLWLGTWGGGLNRFDVATETFTVYTHNPEDSTSIASNVIWSIAEASDGTLWLGTDAGLNKVNVPTDGNAAAVSFTSYPDPNRVETRSGVTPILEDDAGYLWVGYIGGMLARFDPRNGEYRFFMNFAVSQIGSFNAAAKDPETGTLYFGGLNGLLSFNPADISPSRQPPRPLLTSLEIYNEPLLPGVSSPLKQPLSETTALTLRHDQNDLNISFVGLDYEDPSGVLYDFQLAPYDEDWRGITSQRHATYTALAPGKYTFRVRTTNRLGIWNDAATTLEINIRPPWWRTIWAYLVYAGLVGVALWTLDNARRRRILVQEQERIRARELEQAQQLKEAYDKLEMAHTALATEQQKTAAQATQLRELDQAKSRFFANVSHEFRTPLTLTIGPLEDLQREGEQTVGPEAKMQIDLALRNAYRVLDLINEILDVAKLESGRMKLQVRGQDLAAFISDRSQAFVALAERKQITYTVEKPADPLPVHFDAAQLEKVLANLLSNAFKFTPDNGTIRVAMGQHEDRVDSVYFSVRDNGPGIPKDELAHVFDRFHQVDESSMRLQPGTGIGLALVKQLIDRHGGEIIVDSEAGFGSTFTVILRKGADHFDAADLAVAAPNKESIAVANPVKQRAERLLQETAEALHKPAASDIQEEDVTTVLVVEDNAEVRAYVSRHLAATYKVVEAPDGKAGLDLARKLLPDLIVSDVMMPEMDGHQLCKAIKTNRETAFIPVILLTARAASEDKIEGLQGGADDYLTKPFDIQELIARVHNLIASRRQLLAQAGTARPTLQLGSAEVTSADEAFLEQVRDTIESHIGDENFSVEMMADALHMDRSSLFRRLRSIVGKSPAELIWTLRLERAAQLLEAGAGSVSEIAYSVGFKSVAHFSRRFQKHFQVSPSKYGKSGD